MANQQIFNNTLIITGSVTASEGFYGDGSNVTGVVSSSYATTSSYAHFAVSASHEITFEVSSSHALKADQADSVAFEDITDKPTLISSSLQFNDLTSPFTGSFTGSFTGDGTNLTGVVHGTGSTNYLPIWEDSTTIISSSISSTINGSGTVLTRFNNADRIIIDKNSSITSGDPAFNISQDGASKVEFGWDDDGDGFGFIYNYSGEGLKFGTAGANPIMFLKPNSAEITGSLDVTGSVIVSEKVGIGETDPDSILHLKGDTPEIKVESTVISPNTLSSKIGFYGGNDTNIELASIRATEYSSGGIGGKFSIFTTTDPSTPTERISIDSFGYIDMTGELRMDGDVDVTGGITVNAGSNTTQALEATGSLNITGSLELSGSLNISGSLVVDGPITSTVFENSYEDDAEAAAAGVPLYGMYRYYDLIVVRIV